MLDRSFGRDDADLIVLYTSDRVTVDDEGFRQAVIGTLDALPSDVVVGSQTFWSTGSPALVSKDRRSTYAVLQLSGADDDARSSQYEGIADRLDAPGLAERVGGQAAVNHAINDRVATDIALAEGLSMPVVFVLLVFILGGLAAASLPLAVGGLAILGSFTAIRVITLFTDVSVFAINIVTLLGLGLAVDYGLFMVSRYREEFGRATTFREALTRTMTSAGRTVAVSGITVAIALSGLMIFPQLLLRSMGFGGVTAVLVAMVGALTVMPALMAVLGQRVEALSVRPYGPAGPGERSHPPHRGRHRHGTWYRIAHSVMRRPVVYVLAIVVLLVALGAPFSRVSFGGIDERALPQGTESRVVAETLTRDFEGTATPPAEMAIIFPTTMSPDAQRAPPRTTPPGFPRSPAWSRRSWLVSPTTPLESLPFTPGIPLPPNRSRSSSGFASCPRRRRPTCLVGGPTAELADLLSSLASRLPLMALILIGTTSCCCSWPSGPSCFRSRPS